LATVKEELLECNNFFLAGFSQGGAMALYTAYQTDIALKGVICLSGYLPFPDKFHQVTY
jgi:phospholipase/carboxylesterase